MKANYSEDRRMAIGSFLFFLVTLVFFFVFLYNTKYQKKTLKRIKKNHHCLQSPKKILRRRLIVKYV